MARGTATGRSTTGRAKPQGVAADRAEETAESAERRPTAPSLRCLARNHAAAAVDALAAVMRDPSATPAARVSAAGALLAWGYGKAGQAEDAARSRKMAEQVIRLVWGGDDA